MNEPRSVSISFNPAPFVGSLVGKRMASSLDGLPGTNNGRSCPGGFLFKKEQDDGRDSGRPFSPFPPG
jgi:hypothetical protein